jgi:3-hydroxyacyl-[acyl-carrier-protein] dehydratase
LVQESGAMTTVPRTSSDLSASGDSQESLRQPIKPVIDLSGIDLRQRRYTREQIAKYNPHRGEMALLDGIVWHSDDYRQAVAVKHVTDREFWVPGHFPDKPLFPGVMMVEAGAQLACFLFIVRRPTEKHVAFTRIEDCSFRSQVQPGDDFYILCSEIKFMRRMFVSEIQGIVNDKIAVSARISGMSLRA